MRSSGDAAAVMVLAAVSGSCPDLCVISVIVAFFLPLPLPQGGMQVLQEGRGWGGSRGSADMVPRVTMREQIVIRISLRDDVPSRRPSCEDYSAPSWLPSKQKGGGSNPSGRASLASDLGKHLGLRCYSSAAEAEQPVTPGR